MTRLQYATIMQAKEKMAAIKDLAENSKGKAVKNCAEIAQLATEWIDKFDRCDPGWRSDETQEVTTKTA